MSDLPVLGEQPEFSEREKAILRGFIAESWQRIHREKNGLSDRGMRDELTVQLQSLEQLGEKVGRLR
jgi:hypothetical protein